MCVVIQWLWDSAEAKGRRQILMGQAATSTRSLSTTSVTTILHGLGSTYSSIFFFTWIFSATLRLMAIAAKSKSVQTKSIVLYRRQIRQDNHRQVYQASLIEKAIAARLLRLPPGPRLPSSPPGSPDHRHVQPGLGSALPARQASTAVSSPGSTASRPSVKKSVAAKPKLTTYNKLWTLSKKYATERLSRHRRRQAPGHA
jgi:hypothetical protein